LHGSDTIAGGYDIDEMNNIHDDVEYLFKTFEDSAPYNENDAYYEFLNEIQEKVDAGEMKECGYFIDFLLMAEQESLHNELSDGFDDFKERMDINFKNESQAQEWIDNEYPDKFDMADTYVGEGIEEFAFMVQQYHNYGGNWKLVLLEINDKIVNPYWTISIGADIIMKNSKRLIEELENIDKLSLNDQFSLLNQSINAVHVGGQMMEYYEMLFGVSKSDLDDLSESDVGEWDKEMRDIGFYKSRYSKTA